MLNSLITLTETAERLDISEREAGDLICKAQFLGAFEGEGTWRMSPAKLGVWIDANSVYANSISDSNWGS